MPTDQESTQFSLVIVSPDEVVYEGDVSKVIVPGLKQNLAILPDHTPLYAQLSKGDIKIETPSGENESFPTDSGIIRVRSNKVSIVTGFDIQGDVLGSQKN